MKVSQVFWGFVLIVAVFAGVEWFLREQGFGSLLELIPSFRVEP